MAGAVEGGVSAITPKGVGDTADPARRIYKQQVKSNPLDTPSRILRQDNFGGAEQPRLLTKRHRGSRIRQTGPGLNLDDRQQTILFRHYVDFPCRGPHATCENAPTIPLQCQLGGPFGRTAPSIGLPATTNMVYHED